jgi:hypothetical protein
MEEVGLIIEFVEQKYRGSDDITCIVKVTEEGNGIDVKDEWEFDSWEDLKEEYPDFKSLLKEIFTSENWSASWRGGDRVIFASAVSGHEGLYEDIEEKVEWSELD